MWVQWARLTRHEEPVSVERRVAARSPWEVGGRQGSSPLSGLCLEVKTSPAVTWNTTPKGAKWKQDLVSRDEGVWNKMEGWT